MPTVLQVPTSRAAAALYAHCCLLKYKINVQRDKQWAAASWLRRAIGVQSDFGLDPPLAASLQLYADLLNKEAKHQEARQALERSERLMSNYETDPFLKSRLQVDLAKTEVRLGQRDSARARLSGVLPTLRKRKRDRLSADLLPDAAWALSGIVTPSRRLRRKTMPESVQCRMES
jgi:ATP/maltotriose-dependent transcriptional regulator MalT